MQKEITTAHDLLDEQGHLVESGWLRRPILRYNREAIHHRPSLIREWNYFWAGSEDYGIGLSIASMGKLHRLSLHYMEYKTGVHISQSAICPAKDSILKPSLSSFENIHFKNEQAEGTQTFNGNNVNIAIRYDDFNGKNFSANLDLTIPQGDHTVMVIGFDENPGMFYYNHKINCIKIKGLFEYGDTSYSFNEASAWCVMDWGRGVWPAKNTWYWGSANGTVAGKSFGFNIGYGFGNTSAATENMLIYDGKIHKLEHVKFHIPDDETSFMKEWRFSSSDKRFEMSFSPILDRFSEMPSTANYGSAQHQVFGYFNGIAVLDDGNELKINNLFGFAEKVVNSWPED